MTQQTKRTTSAEIRKTRADRQRETTMTTEEAAKFLGVSMKTIGYLHWKYLKPEKVREDQVPPWMPEPVQGSKWTESGVYAASDIVELDNLLDSAPKAVTPRRRVKRRRAK